jgi:chondroitin 4-sulfotransferase 11
VISHKHKCIFVHIRKTGGISLSSFLKEIDQDAEYASGPDLHAPLSWYKKTYGEQVYNDYFKFTFVRNPWGLRVSLRKWLAKHAQGRLGKYARRLSFSDWIKRYVVNCRPNQTGVGLTQLGYLNPVEDMDFIGRFENLQQDFDIICDKIGIPQQELPHENKTNHKHYTEYYDDETKSIVAKKYRKDIEYFGYEFGE